MSSDEAEDLDVRFTATQRRRKLIAALVSLIVVVAIAAVVARSRANKLPALDPEQVRETREALESVPREYHRELAAKALIELEHERIPVALLDPFEAVYQAPPDMIDLVLLRAITEEPEVRDAWVRACPDGLAAVAEAAQSGSGAAHVHQRCDLGRLGLVSETELGGASIGTLVMTHVVWAHLVEHDSEQEIERRLLRTILGRV